MSEFNDIVVNLSKEQTLALDALSDNETTRVLYGGQAGGGKSFLISIWAINMCLNYDDIRGYIGREILKDLKNSILITFFDVCRLFNLQQGKHYNYNDQKSYIDFYNGSRIVLLDLFAYPSDPNFDSLGSTEYTFGAVEEGVKVQKRLADLLISRTRYKHDVYGLHPKQLITCNPGDGWVKDEIVLPFEEGTLKQGVKFIQATLESNPNKTFADNYKKTLEENLSVYDCDRLLNGNWHAKPRTGGEFWKDFRDHHTGFYKWDESLPVHIGWDKNVNPYLPCSVWQIKIIDGQKEILQIGEIALSDPLNRTKHVCAEFIKRYPQERVQGLFVYGDRTAVTEDTNLEKGENMYTLIMSALKDYHPRLRLPTGNPSVVDSANFINEIYSGKIKTVKIGIDKTCKKSIDDYMYSIEDSDGTLKKITKKNPATLVTYQERGHFSDIKRYIITMALSEEYLKYKTGARKMLISMGKTSTHKY